MAMLWTPLNVMQGIYIKHYGFSMGVMAIILLISRVYDAAADIAVGAVSDWVKERTDRRKPLFTAGAVLFGISSVFVYIPPRTVGPLYLSFWLIAFFTSYAILMISHLAWGAELAPGSRQKTAIFSVYKAAGYVGLCLFYSIPLLPIFNTTEVTPATIKWSAELATALLLPALILCLRFVPEGRTNPRCNSRSALPLKNLRNLADSRPFLVLMGAYLLCGGGLGVWYGMIFIFVDMYLGEGALFAPLYLAAFAIGVLASLGWNRIAAVIGKKAAWSCGSALVLATALTTAFLTPQNSSSWSLGMLLVVNTIGFASFELVPGSIVGDVADHSQLKKGCNQIATFFSVFMFLTKAVFALGGAIGLGLAAWLGFNPHMHQQTDRGVHALHVAISWVPSALIAFSIVLIQLIPMDERRHAVVRKRLDQRETRAAKSAAEIDRMNADLPHRPAVRAPCMQQVAAK